MWCFRNEATNHKSDKRVGKTNDCPVFIHSEFYFLFQSWPMCSHWHVILHRPAKFRSNRTTGGGVLTSYRFFKMAATESQIYFWVWFLWWHSFGKMEIYLGLSYVQVSRTRPFFGPGPGVWAGFPKIGIMLTFRNLLWSAGSNVQNPDRLHHQRP